MKRFYEARTPRSLRLCAAALVAAAIALAGNGHAAPAASEPEGGYEAGSPYAHRIAYLKQLRQAKADVGDNAAAADAATQIERLAARRATRRMPPTGRWRASRARRTRSRRRRSRRSMRSTAAKRC